MEYGKMTRLDMHVHCNSNNQSVLHFGGSFSLFGLLFGLLFSLGFFLLLLCGVDGNAIIGENERAGVLVSGSLGIGKDTICADLRLAVLPIFPHTVITCGKFFRILGGRSRFFLKELDLLYTSLVENDL